MGNKRDPYSQLCAIHAQPRGLSGTKSEGTSSGILIDPRQGLVLTHASLLYPLHEQFHHQLLRNIKMYGSSCQGEKVFNSSVDIDIVFPSTDTNMDEVLFDEKNIQPVLSGSALQNISLFTKYKGTVRMVFECKHLRETIKHMMPKDNWQFEADIDTIGNDLELEHDGVDEDDDNNTNIQKKNISKSKSDDLYYALLPCFVLIQLKQFSAPNRRNVLSFRESYSNAIGDPVEICATPFGTMSPEVFLNSRSRGIISKVAGPHNVLLMTDARCVPGCEGGGLFYVHRGQRVWTGMMIASLCWKNSEWVGLSLACAISQLLGSMKQHAIINVQHTPDALSTDVSFDQRFISGLMSSVTCVNVGAYWGSGVCVHPDRGIYLTCSHVLKGEEFSRVKVTDLERNREHTCDTLYRTKSGQQFDIALIQMRDCTCNTSRNSSHVKFGTVTEGDVVFVIGHAIFRNGIGQYPMVTTGIVSKVNRFKGVPVMIQTTCAVHAGASGGGVFNAQGQLVAMVVCNSRDTVSGASYPHVNMCVPMVTIEPAINQYLATNDKSVLEVLEVENKVISQIWSIGTEAGSVTSRL